MVASLKIDDCEFLVPRLTGADITAMTKAGILPEGRGYELIEGVLVAVASQQSPHVEALGAVLRFLNRTLPDEIKVAAGGTVFFSEHTVLEPDIWLYPKGLLSADVRGPDILLAIEISDSTLRFDLGKKARLYAAHGVREYWVFDLNRRLVHRHADPGEDGYARVDATDFAVPLDVPVVDGLRIDPAKVIDGTP